VRSSHRTSRGEPRTFGGYVRTFVDVGPFGEGGFPATEGVLRNGSTALTGGGRIAYPFIDFLTKVYILNPRKLGLAISQLE
jgi:hypothetical protein